MTRKGPRTAIVLGAEGRVGGAFARRLAADGYHVRADPAEPAAIAQGEAGTLLFDCAYRDGEAEAHVARVETHLARWRDYAAIFVPSSCWIEADTDYGHAKRRVEALATRYRGLGATVVTDRIGYFPGDGVAADPSEPMIDRLVDGDTLYARVMARMVGRIEEGVYCGSDADREVSGDPDRSETVVQEGACPPL